MGSAEGKGRYLNQMPLTGKQEAFSTGDGYATLYNRQKREKNRIYKLLIMNVIKIFIFL